MIYTLANNAISSLNIAIEYFKKLYYHSEKYSPSEVDEAFKICITFLENALELLLKTILVEDNPLSIYVYPESRAIQNALRQADESMKLEDILIAEGNFKTITYSEAIELYNGKFYNSDKVYCILKNLGEVRNAITHFGINRANSKDKLIIEMLNAFDVIYNYLYPQLIKIDSIEHIFTSDDLIVETIHGVKPLFDENFIYNNIVDFLDELMETAEGFTLECRLADPGSKINEFIEFFKNATEDRKFYDLLERNQAKIEFHTCDFSANNFSFDIIREGEIFDSIFSCYSRFFNVTAFCNEVGAIYFLVVHDNHEIYLYGNDSNSFWPQWSDPEPDMLWVKDFENGSCQKLNLSKRNILKIFDTITTLGSE